MSVLKRGAEAVLHLEDRDGQKVLVKERIKKGYRVEKLDQRIRKKRTKREEKLMLRSSRAGVKTPRILDRGRFKLVMQYIEEPPLKEKLNSYPPEKREKVCRKIGESVAKLHSSGIVHGDLTTSNMLYRNEKLYLIDFGLGKSSRRPEDQATDLFLLLEALRSTHYKIYKQAWEVILKAYEQNYSHAEEVLNRLEKIKKRRRYAEKTDKE